MTWHYIPVPDEVADAVLSTGSRRVIVSIKGRTVNRAIMQNANGVRYLIASRSLLRDIGAEFGDTIIVEMRPDPYPDKPEIPAELVAALETDQEASERFYAMSPGKQRGLSHYVASAKRPETRERRALELAHKLATYTLYGDLNPPDRQGKR